MVSALLRLAFRVHRLELQCCCGGIKLLWKTDFLGESSSNKMRIITPNHPLELPAFASEASAYPRAAEWSCLHRRRLGVGSRS